ncbi:MAG TPA: hypothetical protein VE964_08850 [Myxococcales bacterium]|jgi:hypothetical protein|nr:hypothetical protein [Myxococcales bacterium]
MKKKKSSKTAARKPAAKKPAARRQAAATYTPKPVQGDGWAPFRYPPQ